jgi:hypothetical protein
VGQASEVLGTLHLRVMVAAAPAAVVVQSTVPPPACITALTELACR